MVYELRKVGTRRPLRPNSCALSTISPAAAQKFAMLFKPADFTDTVTAFILEGARPMLDSSRDIALACALSALAGYVDGIGYLHLGGLFVSFMSGNSTRMGVSIAEGRFQSAAEALALIVLFVVGAAAGSLMMLGQNRQARWRVLFAESVLLVA